MLCSYDTSQLLNKTNDGGCPEFRKVPDWDLDFRVNAWKFFPGLIDPDNTTPETVEIMEKAKKRCPGKIDFDTYEHGLPMMFDVTADGKPIPRGEYAKKLLRSYLWIHNSMHALLHCSPTMLTPGQCGLRDPRRFGLPGPS